MTLKSWMESKYHHWNIRIHTAQEIRMIIFHNFYANAEKLFLSSVNLNGHQKKSRVSLWTSSKVLIKKKVSERVETKKQQKN